VVVYLYHSRLIRNSRYYKNEHLHEAPTMRLGSSLAVLALVANASESAFVNGFSMTNRSKKSSLTIRFRAIHSFHESEVSSLNRPGDGLRIFIRLHAQSSGKDGRNTRRINDNIIDAVVEEKTAGLSINEDDESSVTRRRKRDFFRKALKDIASLSLVDYKWRSELFKRNEADRMEEEFMARMMGEDAAYARPMDADDGRRGPLGNAERSAVKWLTSVIEEEGKRAKRIAESDGELIRPKDLSPSNEAGPLSELEKRAIQFLGEISDSEVERVRSGTVRPKDMAIRGPLGEAEARAVLVLEKIIESEKYRMDQSRRRGETVRPIDVAGPLGEFEKYVGDIIRSEMQRVKDRDNNEGKLVRPKDASMKSALGEVEKKAAEDWDLLRKEENERLASLRKFLANKRPMETEKDSPLGITEAFTVGLLRGPRLVGKVVERVKELLSSEELDDGEKDFLQKSLPASSDTDSEQNKTSSSEQRRNGDDIPRP